ncbi:MAG: glycosyltransferase family 2 protein [Acidimicrobiales bacterium]|nr:glycosyltransferase family 2 protein [Acidimicrobiales bacterium]
MTSTSPPAVNVMVATRDRPELLRRTLQSIAEQDYQGLIETIVIFDRSEPDHSLAVTDGLRRVRVITNERKPGLQGARNTGMEQSTQPVIAFCDDDDLWRPDKVRRQVELLNQHPEVHFVSTGLAVEFEGETTERVADRTRITHRDLLRSRVFDATHPSTFLFRRSLVESVGLIDEDVPGGYGEDYEWILRATHETDIVTICEPLTTVLWHQASFFAERWQMRIDGLRYVVDQHPGFQDEPVGLARIEGQCAFALASLGDRKAALRSAFKTMRLNWKEGRAYLAILRATGLMNSEQIMRAVQKRGRSI